MISAILIILSVIVYVALMRKAYREAQEDARRESLKGGPMPRRPRR